MKYLLTLLLFIVGCNTNMDTVSETYKAAQTEVLKQVAYPKTARFPAIESNVTITHDTAETRYRTDSLDIQVSNDNIHAFVTGECHTRFNDGRAIVDKFMIGLERVNGQWKQVVIEMF